MSKLFTFLVPLAGILGMIGGLASAQSFGGVAVPGKVWILFPLIGLGVGLGLVVLGRSEERADRVGAQL